MSFSDLIEMTGIDNELTNGAARAAIEPRVVDEILKALAGLRFGSLEITVHDGRVTQIECKRKIRIS